MFVHLYLCLFFIFFIFISFSFCAGGRQVHNINSDSKVYSQLSMLLSTLTTDTKNEELQPEALLLESLAGNQRMFNNNVVAMSVGSMIWIMIFSLINRQQIRAEQTQLSFLCSHLQMNVSHCSQDFIIQANVSKIKLV